MPGIGTISTANELLDAVSKFVAPSSTTVSELQADVSFVTNSV